VPLDVVLDDVRDENENDGDAESFVHRD